MTEADATEAILAFWEDGWTTLHPDDPSDPDYAPFVLENEAAAAVNTWLRVSVIETLRQQTTSGPEGSRRFEVRGRIAVQLFTPVDQGTAAMAALCDDVRTVLQGKTITVVDEEIAVFDVVQSTSPPTDGRWLFRVLNAAFIYQQVA